MGNLQITWETILTLCGGIAIVAGAVRIIFGLFNPVKQMREDIANNRKNLERDNKRIAREEEATKLLIRSNFAILKHLRTNNSTGLMDTTIDQIQEFLTEN